MYIVSSLVCLSGFEKEELIGMWKSFHTDESKQKSKEILSSSPSSYQIDEYCLSSLQKKVARNEERMEKEIMKARVATVFGKNRYLKSDLIH